MEFDLEVFGCFLEGGVGGGGHDHLRLGDAAFLICLIPCRETGHQDGFGATTRRSTGTGGGGVEEGEHHGHHFGLHLAHGGEDISVDGVGCTEELHGFMLEGDEF